MSSDTLEATTDGIPQFEQYSAALNNRHIPKPLLYRCGDCKLIVKPWRPSKTGVGRCPDCNHYSNEQHRQKAVARNRLLICPCPRKHTVTPEDRRCVCPCKCSPASDQDDSDYQFVEEADDDTKEKLIGPAVSVEESLARRYGWKTNAISNEGGNNERRIFFEAPGHCGVARMHDLGLPRESSLANNENTIGHTEVTELRKDLEPWELEAIHLSTGISYNTLLHVFPEARRMQLPSHWNPEPRHIQPVMVCYQCHLPYSSDSMQSLSLGLMHICPICCLAQRPLSSREDIDFQNFNAGVQMVRFFCLCRCDCNLNDYLSPTLESGQTFGAAVIEQAVFYLAQHNLPTDINGVITNPVNIDRGDNTSLQRPPNSLDDEIPGRAATRSAVHWTTNLPDFRLRNQSNEA